MFCADRAKGGLWFRVVDLTVSTVHFAEVSSHLPVLITLSFVELSWLDMGA